MLSRDLWKCTGGVWVSRLKPRGKGASLCNLRLQLVWFVPQRLSPSHPPRQLPLLMPALVPAPPPD